MAQSQTFSLAKYQNAHQQQRLSSALNQPTPLEYKILKNEKATGIQYLPATCNKNTSNMTQNQSFSPEKYQNAHQQQRLSSALNQPTTLEYKILTNEKATGIQYLPATCNKNTENTSLSNAIPNLIMNGWIQKIKGGKKRKTESL